MVARPDGKPENHFSWPRSCPCGSGRKYKHCHGALI
jgi:uncharacterized protein YchJ